MEFLRPVRWREGMFLRPHHLQQYDLFVESREIGYLHALEHYGRGFVHLEIQEESLANFVLAVKALRAVFPDGTQVDVPGNARLASRPIERKATEAGAPLAVTLGLRRLEARRPLAPTGDAALGQTRFAAVDEEVYDLDAGKDPAAVEKLEFDLQLFFGDEPTHGYETLPMACLAFSGDPSRPVQLVPGFAPPSLALSGSYALHHAARAVVERLATVLRKMDAVRGSDKIRELILFQAISGCLPVLRDMVSDGKVHPRLAYRELARLAGTLYFRDTRQRSFDEIPAYDHDAPGPVFEHLRALIHELSEPIFVDLYRLIPLERVGDLFRGVLPPEVKLPGTRFFLKVEATDSVPRLPTLLLTAKISGPSRIEILTKFALPGISTERQVAAPPELGPGQTASFYRLKTEEGDEWATHTLPSGEIGVFLLGAPQDIRMTLVVVFPEK